MGGEDTIEETLMLTTGLTLVVVEKLVRNTHVVSIVLVVIIIARTKTRKTTVKVLMTAMDTGVAGMMSMIITESHF